jgi:hypothetical protein
VAAVLGLLATGCASIPSTRSPAVAQTPFELDRDAFAFANLVRAERPGWNDAFANHCLVLARAASQFHRFARFAPDRPAVSPGEYDRLVRSFSAAHEGIIKGALGSNVLSMLHWRTWRVGIDFPPEHQERLARELAREVEAGHPVPLMITNFPHEDLLNHAVLVYARRPAQQGMDFLAYDPNDPGSPFALYYDGTARAFWVGPLTYSPPGRVRVFRVYTSPLF